MTSARGERRKLDVLPPVGLQRATGEVVELGAFLDRMLLAVAVRYYG